MSGCGLRGLITNASKPKCGKRGIDLMWSTISRDGRSGSVNEGDQTMVTALACVGALVVLGFLIRMIRLQEVSVKFRFKGNERPPKQLDR